MLNGTYGVTGNYYDLRNTGHQTGSVDNLLNRARRVLDRPREVTSITIEYGVIKLLVSRGLEMIDYRIVPVNPQFFYRDTGINNSYMVRDTARVGGIIRDSLGSMKGQHSHVISVIPGYTSTLQSLDIPKASGLNPNIAIPDEVRRRMLPMPISLETHHLNWYRLKDGIDINGIDTTRWMYSIVPRRDIYSLVETMDRAGLKIAALDLRAFALARVVNQPDAIIVWTSQDGVDVTIVKDYIPLLYQTRVDKSVQVDSLTKLVEDAWRTYGPNISNMLTDDIPLYLCGHHLALEPNIGQQVATRLQRDTVEANLPIKTPQGFPIEDLIMNVGLALREA